MGTSPFRPWLLLTSFLLGAKQSCFGDDTLFSLAQISQTGCCPSPGHPGAGEEVDTNQTIVHTPEVLPRAAPAPGEGS